MKNSRWLSIVLALALAGTAGSVAHAQLGSSETTTTTTTYSGTVTDVAPSSSTIIVRSPEETPQTYTFTKKTVFLDPSGNVVSAEVMRGKPVTVYYEKDGDQMIVSKVVVSQPVPGVSERTTTTETRREVR